MSCEALLWTEISSRWSKDWRRCSCHWTGLGCELGLGHKPAWHDGTLTYCYIYCRHSKQHASWEDSGYAWILRLLLSCEQPGSACSTPVAAAAGILTRKTTINLDFVLLLRKPLEARIGVHFRETSIGDTCRASALLAWLAHRSKMLQYNTSNS